VAQALLPAAPAFLSAQAFDATTHEGLQANRGFPVLGTAPGDDASMEKDPIVEEVRRIREAQAAKHNFDVEAILAARKRQAQSRRKIVAPVERRKLSA